MNTLSVTKSEAVATVTLSRGKVNALNEAMVEELATCFEELEQDPEVRAVILTGQGKFFSFGFDIPEFLTYPKADFTRYLKKFTGLYRQVFCFSKPVVAALNGHTMAGGCMLASACDWRVMVSDRAKIALNEISFGASVLAGAVEMLGFGIGWRNAQTILYGGAMYSPDEAQLLGLVDQICVPEDLTNAAVGKAKELGGKGAAAFAGIKELLRQPIAERIREREPASIEKFVEVWYSDTTWANLQKITIAR
ncbi:enoyl-CoA hydratase/isomerase family protein [Coraliomargarita parva]|uniref:enoyl-CoA hydratase/isomerase family protein n=1 Tax=Coraliomargarita parva TaxID=3014050 RepID=UPI0022B44763|nr:enoyl-CoA hydratase/isomerase family protein [Coraliomargarita parva]